MSGRVPDHTQIFGNGGGSFRHVGPNWITMPEHFKRHNYTTLGGGKTYHPVHVPRAVGCGALADTSRLRTHLQIGTSQNRASERVQARCLPYTLPLAGLKTCHTFLSRSPNVHTMTRWEAGALHPTTTVTSMTTGWPITLSMSACVSYL
jgi:hypothetical protein